MSEHDRLGIESEAVAAQISADPAFAALEASGAPIVAAAGEPLSVVHANESAIAVFGADLDALGERLFRGEEPGAQRLRELAGARSHAAAARLERLRFSFGPIAQTATVLCRTLAGASGAPPLFLIALLGMRSAASESPLVVAEFDIPPLPIWPLPFPSRRSRPRGGRSGSSGAPTPRDAFWTSPPRSPTSSGGRMATSPGACF